MEPSLNGARIYDSNHDYLSVAEEENSDEDTNALAKTSNNTEIDLEEEHKTEYYQYTLNIYIENTDKIENSHKHYTKQWRTIYEVIQQELFDETDIFPDIFFNIARRM